MEKILSTTGERVIVTEETRDLGHGLQTKVIYRDGSEGWEHAEDFINGIKKQHGGKRKGSGRKSRKELGLKPLAFTSVNVEREVIDECRRRYGSLAEALRYAANPV